MSHSVFRDLDDDKSSGNSSKSGVADNNLIVFINKDGGVQVDPNALQDLIVNANTDTKSTVSVIRLGSPTPSMETDEADGSTKQSEDDDQDVNDSNSDEDNDKNSDESNEDSDHDSDNGQQVKKKKKKHKVPGIGLTVEDFYNPEQAIQFATEIMNIAGITNPKQLKADYDHLRYIIQNDHCYTPYTYADSTNEGKSTDGAKCDVKSKLKLTTPLQTATTKKTGRNAQSSKSVPSNGLDRDASNASNRSGDDVNSSVDNTAERSSEEEEEEEDTDYSNMSESDNDRDSDLDFNVNDSHSRRAKKVKKRKVQAKRLAHKKRRRSTVDFTGSDDGLTPNRKKVAKISRKSLNTSSKSTTSNTTTPTVSTTVKTPATTIKTPVTTVKTPVTTVKTPTTTVKTPAATVKTPTNTLTPRFTKITYVKESPQSQSQSQSQSQPLDKSSSTLPNQKAVCNTSTPLATTSNENKPKSIIIVKAKEKKPISSDNTLSGMSSLFVPDIIKKNPADNIHVVKSQVSTPSSVKIETSKPKPSVMTVHVQQNPPKILNAVPKLMKTSTVTFRKITRPIINLATEQDKQLDLIDSLVQEELSKSELETPISSKNSQQIVIPAAIPNIVKMLETSETSTSIGTPEMTQQHINTSASMPITYTTTQSVTDSQMLPDDLLESFVNSDYLSDDLMQHVAKLVDEDKNLQDIIDQQVLCNNAASMASSTIMASPPPPTVAVSQQKQNIAQTTPSTSVKMADESQPVMNIAKPPTTIAINPQTPGSRIVKRSDGRIITLPPIEAPTTRGAKRRAETTPTTDSQQKSKVITIIVQTESPNAQKTLTNPPSITPVKSSPGQSPKPIAARERRASVAVKRSSIDFKPKRSMSISNPQPNIAGGEDDEDDEDRSDGTANSEDDPHRLWCICRTPHNNRFMICCDKCEEWFHGKCVNITRQMGNEMEQRKSEWICPNCVKKSQPSIKNIFPRKKAPDHLPLRVKNIDAASPTSSSSSSGASQPATNCIVCGVKSSRENSVYCSDDCIRKHASTTQVNTVSANSSANSSVIMVTSPTSSMKSPSDNERKSLQPKTGQLFKDKTNHVVVFDRSTGKYLSGKNAPTADKLQQWLAMHPNHEVLKTGTPQANAFKAKQQQLKSIQRDMQVEKELFAVTQPVKIQTKLRFEADKMVCVNPMTQKQPTTTTVAVKRPISATLSISPVSGRSPSSKVEPITKTPKLTSTSSSKTLSIKKKINTTTESKSTPSSSSSSSSKDRNHERDQCRINARKTLIEQLIARTKEITDPNAPRLTESEITDFVKAAENEMFEMFGGETNNKYKSKYRSLMYNIKDRKNLTLFEKISSKLIEPKQFVRLSSQELASQELAKWRENENKHQLEMITKSELDLLACGNSYVLKTHKGEEVIQESSDRITLDPSIPVQDVVSVLNSSTVSSSDTSIVAKDNRFDKYLTPDKSLSSSTGKKDIDRSDKKDRHESRSSSSSSKHKRKRSRERHSSGSGHGHSHSHSHKDRERAHDKDKDKKERSSGSESRKDKKDHKSGSSSSSTSSNRSKHHHQSSEKDRKRESTGSKTHSTPKIQKTDDNIIDKILKAQSTIDSILHKSSDATNVSNVSSASITSENSSMVRQTSIANESDQEPTSTVTIPSPPVVTSELRSTTPALAETSKQIIWSGSISMIDVATFQVSLSVLSGSAAMIEFPKEFDVVGRITPDTVWEYLEKIRISRDIVLLRFSPQTSSDDDETAYKTFISYLDSRRRLGVIKIPSKYVKDFYIVPLTSHKSLPTILKTTTGFDLEADRPDLLLGIIVRNNKAAPPANIIPPSKRRQSIPFIGSKSVVNTSAKDAHYTPPSSPNVSQVQSISKQVLKTTFASNLDDDDEPYSPGGSDDEDLSTIPTSYLASSIAKPVPDYQNPIVAPVMSKIDKEKLDELNRQIELEKKQIANLQTVDIDEPYSPTSSVSPPINTNLSDVVSNISIPANLVDILKNVAQFGPTPTQMPMNKYNTSLIDASDNEYVPIASTSSSIGYAPQIIQPPIMTEMSSQPSKLAQLTDEELLRLVPDEI